MKLEKDLKDIAISLPLFDIMVGNLKKNISTRNLQIPEDKTTLVFNKLNDLSILLKTTQKELTKQIDSIEGDVYRSKFPSTIDEKEMMKSLRSNLDFKFASGTIKNDISVLEKILDKTLELKVLFSNTPKYFDHPVYSKYQNKLYRIYLDFINIENEFKTLVKWYNRLLELGY